MVIHSLWSSWSDVEVSRSSWLVSVLLGRRGQSSCSVVLRGQSSWSMWSDVVSVVLLGRRGQSSSWSVVLHGQSFSVVSRSAWSSAFFFAVVVSYRGQLFFVISLLGRHGQSSWSMWSVVVVSRSSWIMFILYGGYAHVFTKTYGLGKPYVFDHIDQED